MRPAPSTPRHPAPRRRSRPLRVERDDVLWFVTSRTIEERYWLHPLIASGLEPPNRTARRGLAQMERHADKRIARMVATANARRGPHQPQLGIAETKRIARGLVGSALGRALERYGVQLFALVVMSNHVHMVVRTPHKNLAKFMGFFKARVADSVNRITGKSGPLWSRRYDAQPIMDDTAVAGRVAYTLDNPVSANLVDDFEQWPGLNLAFGVGDSDELDFEYLNCTAWHRKGRPKQLNPFFELATVTLHPVPACEGMDRDLYKRSVLSWMHERRQEREVREVREVRTRTPLGVDETVHSGFDARPARPKSTRRPYVFGSRQARSEHLAMMSQIHATHFECADRFLNGDRAVKFPPGTYPPPILAAA